MRRERVLHSQMSWVGIPSMVVGDYELGEMGVAGSR